MDYPLSILSAEEIKVLYKIFGIKPGENSESKLLSKLSKLLLPYGGVFQGSLSYEETIEKIANKNDIDLPALATVAEKEGHLFINLFSKSFNSLSEDEKKKFLNALKEKGLSKDQVASITALTSIGAAQLSGFGVYLLASSTVAAITNALGITLSFAFYTAMSSIIKFAIGPIGFILAAIPLFKTFKDVRSWEDLKQIFNSIYSEGENFFKGNYQSAELIVQYFASLRIMKIHQAENERDSQLKYLKEVEHRIGSITNEKEQASAKLIVAEKELEVLEEKIKQINLQRENLIQSELQLARIEKENSQKENDIKMRIKTKISRIQELKND